MKTNSKYAVTLKSFVNTNGQVFEESVNTFEAVTSRPEAAMLIAMSLVSVAEAFSHLPGFDPGEPSDPNAAELHMVIKVGDVVIATMDAVPVQATKAVAPRADSFRMPSSKALN